MPNWCANNLKIHGSLEQIAEIKKLMNGEVCPYYFNAVNRSIKFFIVGIAGIAQIIPSELMLEDNTFDAISSTFMVLHSHITPTPMNIAFTQWFNLLRTNPDLSYENSTRIIQLYEQSGLTSFSLDILAPEQKQVIHEIMAAQSYDWLGVFGYAPDKLNECWEKLDETKTSTQPFDMRQLIAPKLIPELVGFNGHWFDKVFTNSKTSYHEYIDTYGVKWPSGSDLHLEDLSDKTATGIALITSNQISHTISVDFDTPWAPPNQAVFMALSAKFQCHVIHYFCEQGANFCGRHEYKSGELIDECNGELEWRETDEDDYGTELVGPAYILNNLRNYGG
ncbi:hypothetical protein CUZ56_01373 [Saezia sanguinis]|uniref:Uncharacterized protein n=1 Tax=Saezia sanguinis TaxID=1965230 RepID=A0A433SFB7_9BURK|nr:DUF1281 domain-containing protein [Saezia sanguinis]RUS67428.1 hypothetical protein CUZ56_01373 [Saezia sanguinis]